MLSNHNPTSQTRSSVLQLTMCAPERVSKYNKFKTTCASRYYTLLVVQGPRFIFEDSIVDPTSYQLNVITYHIASKINDRLDCSASFYSVVALTLLLLRALPVVKQNTVYINRTSWLNIFSNVPMQNTQFYDTRDVLAFTISY